MRAFVCDVSVTMPACEPVRLIARWPRSLIAIAHRAHEIRSPVESSMSISRGSGAVDTSSAIEISSSVVLPRAESTATTRWPCSRADTIRRAARLIRSASATDVPPNFITTVPDTLGSLGVVGYAPLTTVQLSTHWGLSLHLDDWTIVWRAAWDAPCVAHGYGPQEAVGGFE